MWNYTPLIFFFSARLISSKKKHTTENVSEIAKKEINKIQQCEYIQKYGN